MKRLKLEFVDEKVSAIVQLLDDKAPETCRLIWDILESPLDGMVVHAMFTGRELSFTPPNDRVPERALQLPPENQIVLPIPGDLVWNGYRPYEWQGLPYPVYDLGIFYGRDSRLLLPVGWRPSAHIGVVVENLANFASVSARCQTEGKKELRIERL